MMKDTKTFLHGIDSFDEDALDPQIASRLENDPELRAAFDAQRHVMQLVQLKRYETQSPDSAKRIRAGVLRTIRSEPVQETGRSSAWWGGFKLAGATVVLLLLALPFALKPGADIQPVTSFAVSGDGAPALQVPEGSDFLIASNTAPSTQFAPIDVAPVNFDIP